MAYNLPTFDLPVGIWRNGNATTNPPDVAIVANLAYGERSSVPWQGNAMPRAGRGCMWLLCPAGTDIRDTKAVAGADTVEAPLGSGRFYGVVWVDDAGSGFPNQHRFAELADISPWPVPFPSPIITPPTPPSGIPLGVGGDPTPTLSFPIPFTAPPQNVVGLVTFTAPNGTAVTFTSALLGVLGLESTSESGNLVVNAAGSASAIWAHPGGADTLTVSFSSPAQGVGVVVGVGVRNLDQADGGITFGSVVNAVGPGPNAHAATLGFVAGCEMNQNNLITPSSGWSPFTPASGWVSDGVNVRPFYFFRVTTAVETVNVTCAPDPMVSYQYAWVLLTTG